jgi:predicted transcriptional regulator
LLRSELQAKADDLDKSRLNSQKYCREMEELKKCHQLEMENEKEQEEKARQDLLLVAQSQLHARETQLQEHAKNLFAEHCQALQVFQGRLRWITLFLF